MNETTDTPATAGVNPPDNAWLGQLRLLWQHRYLMLAVAAVVATFVALWTLRQPKIYQADNTIEFNPDPPRPLGRSVEGADESSSFWATRENYVTQIRIIQSERIAEAVVHQLGLEHDPDFLGVPLSRRGAFHSVTVGAAAAALRGRIHVEQVRESRLMTISVEDTDPRRARLLANTISAVYIRQNLEKKLSTTMSTLEWLDQQVETLRGRLEQSERDLYEYRLRNNLLSVSYEDRRNHFSNRIVALSAALTEAQTHRIGVSSRVGELRRAAQADDPLMQHAPELLSSSALNTYRQSYEGLQRERDGLGVRYGDNSQQMQALDARIAELRSAIRTEVQNILASAESELHGIDHAVRDLQNALATAQSEALELNLREIEYGRLQRDRENNSKLYGLVLERSKETDLTRMLRFNNVAVLDEAQLPAAPVKPKVLINLAVGVLGGLFLGILAAFVVVQADRTVRSQYDVEERLQATFLGIVPQIRTRLGRRYYYGYRYRYGGAAPEEAPVTNADLVVHTHPTSNVAEACRAVRTNLLFMSPDKPLQVLMVTSASPREGKTTVAVNLAIALAQSGKKVLLVDADLRRPRIHKAFGIRPPVGVTSVLVNEATLDEAVSDCEVPNLSLLPCGPVPPNPAELLHSQRFQDLIALARTKFDRVVIDTPPVNAVTDASIIGPQVDGAILITRARKTLRAHAIVVLTQLRGLGTRIAGVVLNDVDPSGERETGYYYSHQYRYGTPTTQKEAA